MHFQSARRTNTSDIEVSIKSLLLLVLAFIAGYFVALLRERITLQRERNAEPPQQGQIEG